MQYQTNTPFMIQRMVRQVPSGHHRTIFCICASLLCKEPAVYNYKKRKNQLPGIWDILLQRMLWCLRLWAALIPRSDLKLRCSTALLTQPSTFFLLYLTHSHRNWGSQDEKCYHLLSSHPQTEIRPMPVCSASPAAVSATYGLLWANCFCGGCHRGNSTPWWCFIDLVVLRFRLSLYVVLEIKDICVVFSFLTQMLCNCHPT